jgi:hypothetical protein
MSVQISKMQKRLNTPVEKRKPLGKENKFWDELSDLYSRSLGASQAMGLQILQSVDALLNNPKKKECIKDISAMTNVVNLITKDIENHQNSLTQIHNRHKGKTGGTTDADDHMLVISIHSDYLELVEQFNSVIMSNVKVLSDIISQTETEFVRKENEQKQLNSLTDPTVITDVEVK